MEIRNTSLVCISHIPRMFNALLHYISGCAGGTILHRKSLMKVHSSNQWIERGYSWVVDLFAN